MITMMVTVKMMRKMGRKMKMKLANEYYSSMRRGVKRKRNNLLVQS